MAVDIGRALQDGVERTIARNGLYLIVITFVLNAIIGLLTSTIVVEAVDWQQIPGGAPPMSVAPSLGLSPAVAGVLVIVGWLLQIAVIAAALRTFVTEETEIIPGEYFTRNYGWMLLSLIVGGIVFAIVVGIGLVVLILPGIFLLVSLFFWNVYVVVEDENFVEGFSDSWELTKGNRLRLFALGVIVMIVSVVGGGILGLIPGIAGIVVSQIGTAVVSVFVLATIARTYEQLIAGKAVEDETRRD